MTVKEEMNMVGDILELAKDLELKELTRILSMCIVYRTTKNKEKIIFPDPSKMQ